MNIWSGEKVKLRAVMPSDSFLYEDTDITKMYDMIEFPYTNDVLGKMLIEENNKNTSSDDFLFTITTLDNTPIGQITAFDCNRRMGCFKYGLFLSKDYQRGGYGRDAANILLNYYFNQLRYHKANVYIYACNEKSQKFHESLGFVYEGRSRECAFFDGQFIDVVHYGLLDREFNEAMLSSR